jgi:hypothetical protein
VEEDRERRLSTELVKIRQELDALREDFEKRGMREDLDSRGSMSVSCCVMAPNGDVVIR